MSIWNLCSMLESGYCVVQQYQTMLNILITYIWFGGPLAGYILSSFHDVSSPTEILINPPTNYTYNSTIMKSERYRLERLENGGAYADLDVYFNYPCLMGMLGDFKGEMLVMRYGDDQQWRDAVPNKFIYVPADNTALIKEILKNEGHNCTNEQVGTCNGPQMLNKYRKRITIQDMDACMGVGYNYTSPRWEYKYIPPPIIYPFDQVTQENQELLAQASQLRVQRNYMLGVLAAVVFFSLITWGWRLLMQRQTISSVVQKNKTETSAITETANI